MFFFFEESAQQHCEIIDYRDIYDRLKDIPATWTREFDLFSRLWYWHENDPRRQMQ